MLTVAGLLHLLNGGHTRYVLLLAEDIHFTLYVNPTT